jgi:hypothetical protein
VRDEAPQGEGVRDRTDADGDDGQNSRQRGSGNVGCRRRNTPFRRTERSGLDPGLSVAGILAFRESVEIAQHGDWLWCGPILDGQPKFRYRGRLTDARAIAWWLEHCVWPERDAVVLRTCGNPLCVCPDHLVLAYLPERRP